MCKKVKLIVCFCLMLTSVLSVIGCVERFPGEETDYSTGDVLTPEMIESIFEAISTPVTEKYPTETLEGGGLLVYWLDGGSVWHASIKCGSVAKASPEDVRLGDIGLAVSSGKERGCKICTAGLETDSLTYTETVGIAENTDEPTKEKYPKDYDPNGNLIVYWLKSGSVWHVSKMCSSLSKASENEIINGSEEDAKSSGKERVCKKCSDEN